MGSPNDRGPQYRAITRGQPLYFASSGSPEGPFWSPLGPSLVPCGPSGGRLGSLLSRPGPS
eukprot:5838248-Pyramimonas_sp.AAC.1